MVAKSRLQEFGFVDADKFPQRLINHAVMLSLPSALENGLDPLEVIIEDGLVIPLQISGSSGGMIVRNDGRMLHVGHQDPSDSGSPLESRFIQEIPYDARIEVSNIMRRAVQADPSLAGTWDKLSLIWTNWFPAPDGDDPTALSGEFRNIAQAWKRIGDLIGQLSSRISEAVPDAARIKVIVQAEMEFKRGWLGEEFVVDEASRRSIIQQGLVKYLMQSLFPKIQKALRNPVFLPGSVFRLYYGFRRVYVIKLVIVPPDIRSSVFASSAGIELTLDTLDGFSPSFGEFPEHPDSGGKHG